MLLIVILILLLLLLLLLVLSLIIIGKLANSIAEHNVNKAMADIYSMYRQVPKEDVKRSPETEVLLKAHLASMIKPYTDDGKPRLPMTGY